MNYQNYFPASYQPMYYPGQMPPAPVPLTQAAPAAQQQTIENTQTYVNGIDDVASWVVQRGQSVCLFDRNQNTFYVKSVSDNGMPNPIEIYDYTLRETAADKSSASGFNPDEYVKREELDALKEQLRKLRRREDGDEQFSF